MTSIFLIIWYVLLLPLISASDDFPACPEKENENIFVAGCVPSFVCLHRRGYGETRKTYHPLQVAFICNPNLPRIGNCVPGPIGKDLIHVAFQEVTKGTKPKMNAKNCWVRLEIYRCTVKVTDYDFCTKVDVFRGINRNCTGVKNDSRPCISNIKEPFFICGDTRRSWSKPPKVFGICDEIELGVFDPELYYCHDKGYIYSHRDLGCIPKPVITKHKAG